jgi:peroxiredoxin
MCATMLLSPRGSLAGKYNPTLDVGDAAPNWKSLPSTDGQQHSLADLKQRQVVVVVFTCNTCPYAVDYEKRLVDFVERRCGADSKVSLVAINVNLVPDDSLEAMKQRAKASKFNFPYLFDATQQIGRDYGATYTPECFVLDSERKVVYMGAIDDNTDPEKVTKPYMELAVAAALTGKQPAVEETVAIGCAVRYKRVRRKR